MNFSGAVSSLLFTDKEYFDIWSKTISGEDWRDIIGNLDINSPVEAEIKKILFTDKTHFEVWLKAIRIAYLLNIIDNIKTYNETDCIIAYKFFDNNEVFEILSQKINEDEKNITLNLGICENLLKNEYT